jgi:hypothetical protein
MEVREMEQRYERLESRKRKLFVTFAVAVMAGLGVFVTSAAFTATTENSGDRIEAGSVAIGDSDAGTGVLYNALDQKPGAGNGPTAKCIRVTYSGSLASSVSLYRSAVTNGADFRLKIERAHSGHGTPLTSPAADMNCTGFVGGSTAFDDTLDQLGTSYATGVAGKDAGAAWATGGSVDYKFTIYTVDDTTANAHTSKHDSGTHSFTWEARNN